ncbi:hypothetical protein DSL72_006988 [Monilinia vaccinii-corymbosi]|uniref:Uncharacterized protein n=1 Tax=Monilinia vaccinii-corymbosi TaxID=61207 RepID=A0A8A3PLY1_9HELO|nr:hypothetical protein DSL72_006988 [Monilinia vaccinii-corymbosi]
MPPKQKTKPKGSAPTNRKYKAVEPLHQTIFPEMKSRLARNYGKKSGIKLEKQDTLTQMDWVQLYEREDQEEELEDGIEDSEGDYEKEESKRKTKRRKTLGDEPATIKKKASKNRRKTLGEEGSTPDFSTQTITQLEYWPLSGAPEEQVNVEDASIYDIPVTSPPAVHPPRRSPRQLPQSDVSAPVESMPPPQTPRHRKVFEIPSSQSPATPTSSQFGGSARRRSPLEEQSTNIAVPFSLRSYVSAEKLPRLKIEDTFETAMDESQVSRTPSKRSSPTKTVRFAVPDPSQESLAVETPIKQEPATQRGFSPSPMRRGGTPAPKSIKLEILDSDAEEDQEEEESQVVADTPVESDSGNERHENATVEAENIVEGSEQDDIYLENDISQTEVDAEREPDPPETFYGDIGVETQFHAERIMSSSGLRDPEGDTLLSQDTPRNVLHSQSQQLPTQHTQTQHTQTRYTQTQAHHIQFGNSQYPESQRLSTQQLDTMAPRSEGSDIFISIYPTHVENIISRKKDHEFRSYTFPATVSRIWIYQTKPLSTLTHMAVIGTPKTPGEIKSPDGLGNTEFDAGETRSKFAYEILELYALANPMTFEELKSRQWFKAAPQKYARVPPAVLGELIANLLPPLFIQSPSSSSPTTNSSEIVHSTPILHRTSSTSTESQEVQDQLTNNIAQFTQAQVPPSSPSLTIPHPIVHVPSSSQHHVVRSSQASTVDYTQTQTPVTPRYRRKESPIPDIIPESPAKPRSIPSSSPASSPACSPTQMLKSVISRREERTIVGIESQSEDEDKENIPIVSLPSSKRVIEIERQSEYEDEEKEVNHNTVDGAIEEEQHPSSTPQHYSLIHSSQLMTRSQMMREQDSLMDREVMGPPLTMGGKWGEVGDSEEEEDDDDWDLRL